MKKRSAMLRLSAVLLTAAANGAEYYVAANGSDGNSGTSPDKPWKSISKVESNMSRFTSDAASGPVTVYFRNTDTWTDQTLDIDCYGTAANPVVFDGNSWGGTDGSRARFTRTSKTGSLLKAAYSVSGTTKDAHIEIRGFEFDGNGLISYANLFFDDANYVTVRDCIIHSGVTTEWNVGIRFHTTGYVGTIHHLTVEDCEIHGTGAHGIAFYPSNTDAVGDITVRNNTIHNFGNCDTSQYGAGVQVMSCYNGIISGNLIYNGAIPDGFGIKLEDRSRECRYITITGNIIHGGPGEELKWGITNDGGKDIVVHNNIIRDTIKSGIAWGSPTAATGDIYNNTISGTGDPPIWVSSSSSVGRYENNVDGASIGTETDTQKPSVPGGLAANILSPSAVGLSWTASIDDTGVTEYNIYRNGSLRAAVTGTNWTNTGLTASTTYSYNVSAMDDAGNESDLSSPVSITMPGPDELISSTAWQNMRFDAQTGKFTIEYDAIPASDSMDGVTGLSFGPAAAYGDMAVIPRFSTAGTIDARNADSYTADLACPYSAGRTYHFRIEIDLPAHTYSIYVTDDKGTEILIAADYAFRTEQQNVQTLDTINVRALSGSHRIFNFEVVPIVVPAPPSRLRIITN